MSRYCPLIALVAMFIIATFFPINIGILGFIGAFGVGAFLLGYDDKEILAAFPSSIVLTIVGVTYFFGMAKKNGTIDLLVNACIRGVRGRVTVVPWVFFFCASVLTALGTFSPAAVALISPAAMSFAARTKMSPLVMGIMTINGAHAGAFSPISVSGVLVCDIVESSGLSINPWTLFFASYGINLLLSVLTVVGYATLARMRTWNSVPPAPTARTRRRTGLQAATPDDLGHRAHQRRVAAPTTGLLTRPAQTDVLIETQVHPVTRVQKLTLALIGIVLVLVLVFHLPISFVAIAAGAILAFTDLSKQSEAIAGISWSTVLLVAGMVTYISLMQEIGTIDHLAEMAITIGAPLLVAAGPVLRHRHHLGIRLLHSAADRRHPDGSPAAADRGPSRRRSSGRPGHLGHRRRRVTLLDQRRARPGQRPRHPPAAVLPPTAAQRRHRRRHRTSAVLAAAGRRPHPGLNPTHCA